MNQKVICISIAKYIVIESMAEQNSTVSSTDWRDIVGYVLIAFILLLLLVIFGLDLWYDLRYY